MSPAPSVVDQEYIDHPQMALELFAFPQQWIPFLGAGVSASAAPVVPEAAPPNVDPRIIRAMTCLQDTLSVRDERTLFFLQSAMELALELERRGPLPDTFETFNNLRDRNYPPSTSELTDIFRGSISAFESVAENLTRRLQYMGDDVAMVRSKRQRVRDSLDRLANLCSVSAPPLSVMSSHFELTNSRTAVLKKMRDILEHKNAVTSTHKLIARAAAAHLSANKGHYLIITTNYDCLMEKALAASPSRFRVPYVVLHTSKRGNDFVVRARFGNMRKDMRKRFEKINQVKKPQDPDSWSLRFPEPKPPKKPKGPERERKSVAPPKHLVIVYKLHGCIHDILRCPQFHRGNQGDCDPCPHDGIVLSDEDYLRGIAALARNGGVIPVEVAELMRRPRILFLGYSLKDWNVRGFLRALREKLDANRSRPRDPDRAIVRSLTRLEETFFLSNIIDVWITELNAFSATLDWCADRYGFPSY
jgi:hypothetical protein